MILYPVTLNWYRTNQHKWWMVLTRETTGANFSGFDLTWPGLYVPTNLSRSTPREYLKKVVRSNQHLENKYILYCSISYLYSVNFKFHLRVLLFFLWSLGHPEWMEFWMRLAVFKILMMLGLDNVRSFVMNLIYGVSIY